ncbi:dihydroxyacetone kinase subunit DhaL [Candidatus Cetobacterium colombiensis]|uniref:Dihydroxyacetone kinase subunit DhaL n=1 Tax=Candidatus Cetobacterium colombiensis TaxID=3073100 RepID=A0ABU4W660_9FUSO|nr:dihydroxyacetone kinase subunit DhaL [Candidatus Cetobacterium colombiensis]MDX8335013.1 dihydroxyacetone kinase subunit DhaL [Candidatus Cetobacterium colombiensis]
MDLLLIINNVADKIIKNRDYLSELDREIGDSDHGVNLARGFEKIKFENENLKKLNYSDLFNKIAMIIISNVGGASGAIYGTGLMKVAQSLKGVDTLNRDEVLKALEAMVDGIKMRGKAECGEKTMLDTIVPVVGIFKTNKNEDLKLLLNKIQETAKKGVESTKDMLATKGRASYLGERSVGHLDPGAMSSYFIIDTICENLKQVDKC